MRTIKIPKCILLILCCCTVLLSAQVRAEDVDLFAAAVSGAASAPNVIILLDNSPNWSRASQHWPDNGGNQGQAEAAAIEAAVNQLSTAGLPMNVGLAMLSEYPGDTSNGATPGTGGGYIRFGARDITVSANATALDNILSYISSNITSPSEKLSGMSQKDESAAFYEIYKYFAARKAYSGIVSQNAEVDVAGNANTATGAGQGLSSGFAIASDNDYKSPINSSNCGRNYIIYISNNANNTGSAGRSSYQSSIADVAPALTPIYGTNQLVAWTDEWTHYLYSHGVPVPGNTSTSDSVVTYVLDAYNAQNNTQYSNLLQAAAKVGGGRYFQVGSESDITAALLQILAEIQGVNSTFASAALPVNTTNRSQNKNEVFIPMFRPDAGDAPRWLGNLKQYQLIKSNGLVELGDAAGNSAINTLTGYPQDCATSFWTTDSGSYWSTYFEIPVPKGNCYTSSNDPFSDAPDGPIVEKGGVAEVIRKGNNPPTTNTTPTWAVNRKIYTLSGSALTDFTTTSSGLSQPVVDFIQGHDVDDENYNSNVTEIRPSLHGDSIHSRPLPIDYGGTTGVVTYYGSNDGMFRAIDADSGRELWAFVAPEHYSKLQRLLNNSPLVYYPNMPAGITPTPTRKDYFFDGSFGVYQNADNSKVWIYPAMRRGGRMLYAFDVTNPAAPSFKWKAGCPNLTDNTGCTTGMSGIGQTWSTPVVASIKGYSTTTPVVIVGGGYDACEDGDTASPGCGSATGAAVYVLDADTGALLKSFSTMRSVAADISVIDMNNDGYVDVAYAVDTGGNIYRLDFTSGPSGNFAAQGSSLWAMNRVAYTNGAGRKFLFAPALLPAGGNKVYLALGTGDREHPLITSYPYTTPVLNRFYVYLDDLTATTANNLDDVNSFQDFSGTSNCSTTGVLPGSSFKGWFMNLNQYGTGEQVVTSAVIAGGMVTFSTNRPVPATLGSCANSLGEARGYWVNLINGSGAIGVEDSCGGALSTLFTGGGLPPSPVMGTVAIDGSPTTVILGAAQRDGSASGVVSPQRVTPTIKSTRKMIYWKFSGVQ